MKRFVALLALLPLAGAALAQNMVTEKIALQFLRASEMVQMLSQRSDVRDTTTMQEPALPPGVERMWPDERDRTLTVRGTAAAVAQIKELVRFRDVPPRLVNLKMRLVGVRSTANGGREEQTIGAPEVRTINNMAAKVSVTQKDSKQGTVGGWEVEVLPRINGDKSVTLWTELRLSSSPGGGGVSVRSTRRIENGKTDRVVQLMEPRGGRRDPLASAARTVYYLEVTAAEATPTPKQATP